MTDDARLIISENRAGHLPCQLYPRYRDMLRYTAHAPQLEPRNWIRLRCFLPSYLYLHVAVYSGDQGVSTACIE